MEEAPCCGDSVKAMSNRSGGSTPAAGLAKVALALYHRQLPPTLHVDRPASGFGWDGSGLRLQTALEPWPATDGPRLAAVSSFGFSVPVLYGESRPSAIM